MTTRKHTHPVLPPPLEPEPVEHWYVRGSAEATFQTKIEAEAYARRCFPNETADQRYARIYYKML